MARCFQQPVHNGLSEAFRGKSLGIDLCHTFIIEFSQNSVQMSGDTVLILTAADTFHHICYITGQHFFGSDDSGLLSCGMICCRSPVNILPYLPRGSLYDGEFSPGCIMSVLHSGGLGCLSAVCPQDRGVRIHCSQHCAQFLLGNVSGPQDLWR